MSKVIGRVASLCPECLGRVDGEIVTDGDRVSMIKNCPDHGTFRAVIWLGTPS